MASTFSLREEFLTCAICTEFFTDPCTLGCQHSFCRKCITGFIKTRPDAVKSRTIPCAFCRQDTRVPHPNRPVEEWAGQFKPSLMLKGLMDRFQSGHKHREGQDVCFLCEEVGETTQATCWCCDCEVTLCGRCAKMHLKAPSSTKHDLLQLSHGVKVKQRRKVKCSVHEGEQIKYICNDCNKSACHICCTIKHRGCRHVVTIESMVPEIKSTLREERRIFEKKMHDSKAHMKQEESKLQQLKEKAKTTELKITSEMESVISLLRRRKKELLKELHDETGIYISQHEAIIKSGQIITQTYQESFEFIDQVLQSESEMEMYEMYQVCQSGAATSVGDTESDTRNTPVVSDVTFTPNIEPLRKAITEMGGVDVTLLEEVTPMSGTGHELTANLKQGPIALSESSSYDIIDIKSGDDRLDPDPVDVKVLTVHGVVTVVTADLGNNVLKSVYIEKNGSKRFSVLPLSGKPLRICRVTKNRVAATVNDSHIVIAEVRPELVLVSKLKTIKQYRALTSLFDLALAVGPSRPPSIDILDLSGDVIRSFTPESTGLTYIQNPHYMCTTHGDNILVTDFSSKIVYCLSPMGEVVFTYTPIGHGKPRGITITVTGNILLSTDFPYGIIQLTSSGTFPKKVLTSTADIGDPWGICAYDKDTLYVCERYLKGCVKIIRLK